MTIIKCAALAAIGEFVLFSSLQGEDFKVDANDPHIVCSDYVRKEIIPFSDADPRPVVRFDRIIDMPGKGYQWDNPGARIRFRTDASSVVALLRYSKGHISQSARNGRGLFTVDGQMRTEWGFQSSATSVVRPEEEVEVVFPVPNGGGFHDYEVIMPYADSVEFMGLRLSKEARLEDPAPRPVKRYLAFGDSITHGFTASQVGMTYPFLVAEGKKWQVLDMGLGGRSSNPADGAVIGSLKADVISILMGVNDWQGGKDTEGYRRNMEGLLAGLRQEQPEVPVYLITPLWVPPSWKPANATCDLEEYRQVLREIAGASGDSNLHLVEGPELIDHEERYFDNVAVHPNDEGFQMMAQRLMEKMVP